MKPKPFSPLNHFTVPWVMCVVPACIGRSVAPPRWAGWATSYLDAVYALRIHKSADVETAWNRNRATWWDGSTRPPGYRHIGRPTAQKLGLPARHPRLLGHDARLLNGRPKFAARALVG